MIARIVHKYGFLEIIKDRQELTGNDLHISSTSDEQYIVLWQAAQSEWFQWFKHKRGVILSLLP
jgi:hypothetical protein